LVRLSADAPKHPAAHGLENISGTAVTAGPFSSPKPVVSWSRGSLQIKPSDSENENAAGLRIIHAIFWDCIIVTDKLNKWFVSTPHRE